MVGLSFHPEDPNRTQAATYPSGVCTHSLTTLALSHDSANKGTAHQISGKIELSNNDHGGPSGLKIVSADYKMGQLTNIDEHLASTKEVSNDRYEDADPGSPFPYSHAPQAGF
jgi:hypothetical protein